ncbi:NXPE family member 3-like [Branchiostoma floridae]|uniref:NXPE family member 3-like n=1 Tax=Branchiostoma floridae TaxID=7739 RepID=A0A9J7HGH2_BRAFL|nr:NXPE family member 3-like [Branchiostoma floridae]
MNHKFKCVLTVAMGTSVFLFFGLANKQFWQLRSYKPFHAPAPLSRHLFPNGSVDKTTADRLSRLLQEFTGSYLDIPTDNETATSADFTEFQILHPGSVYRVGDILSVMIRAKDMRNREKTRGGDFFRAKIYTERTKSSAPGRVRDFGNGTYGVRFRLLWEGDVTVSVRMVHSSSAVRVIKRVAESFPFNRSRYQRRYITENKSLIGWCSLNPNDLQGPEGGGICDFSDSYAGVEWYCQRPEGVSCSHSVFHRHNGYLKEHTDLGLTEEEMRYFKFTKNGRGLEAIKAEIQSKNSTIQVEGNSTTAGEEEQLPSCRPGLPVPVPSGYYRNGRWVSRVCATTRLSPLEYKKCLQNKVLDFLGDSTVRQWAEFLAKLLNMRSIPDPYFSSGTAGPEHYIETKWNITTRYQSHGPPLKTYVWTNATVLSNLARIIDSIPGGPDRVVVVTLGLHFSNHPLSVFIRRVRAVRAAILRLRSREPETIVVIKTPNTSGATFNNVDEWPLFQIYRVMKEMFSGLSVVLVDTWEMTDCQFHEDNAHPTNDVISEEVSYMLSYVCV